MHHYSSVVAAYYNKKEALVRYGKTKNTDLILITHIAIYICKNHYDIQNKTIVDFFKLKNSKVIEYIVQKIFVLCEENESAFGLKEQINEIDRILREIDQLMGEGKL